MRSPLLVTALLLAACGGPLVTSTQFRGPDGSPNWWGIECRRHPSLCWREAGTVCPNGYTVKGGGDRGTADLAVVNGQLTVQCKGPSLQSSTHDDRCDKPENLRPDDCAEVDQPRTFLPEAPQQ
jgi:hypothetical protein